MNPTTIGWPKLTHTWNPVVGCPRGCPYCYARKLHNKRHKAKLAGAKLPDCYISDFRTQMFYPDRLKDSGLRSKTPRRIFVGSVSDVFFWKPEWIEAVIETCKKSSQHEFMFLTKNAQVYHTHDFPSNCILGVTITGIEKDIDDIAEDLFTGCTHPRKFISIEPLLGVIDIFYPRDIEMIIVGAMTGHGATPPKEEWIKSIRNRAPIDIHWKKNIYKHLGCGLLKKEFAIS